MDNQSHKKVVVNSMVYSVSGVLLKCFSFFLLPLYSFYLTTEDYGITSIVASFIGTMTYIVSLSLYSAVERFFVDYKEKPELLKRFYGTVASFTFLSGIVFFIIVTVFKSYVSKKLFSGFSYYPLIFCCLISLVLTCQATIYDSILKSQQKAVKSSVISILVFLVTVGLNIIFVVVLKKGALGSILATLIAQLLCTVIFWFDMIVHNLMTVCLDWKLLREALSYSIPIIPHNLATKLAVLISKLLIGDFASLSSVGIYTVASQFGDVADSFQGYIDQAYQPWLYQKLKEKDSNYKNSIRSIVKTLISFLGLVFICIALFSHDYIILFVNDAYWDAWKYIPFIILVFAIKTVYYYFVKVLFYHKKAARFLFVASLFSSLSNILISFLLIPKYGILGSIAADVLAMIIRVSIVVFLSIKVEVIGLRLKDFSINFLTIVLFIGIGLIPSYLKYQYSFSFINLGYKIFVVLIYVLLLYIRYKQQILAILRKITHK